MARGNRGGRVSLSNQGRKIGLPAFSGNGGFGVGPIFNKPSGSLPTGVRGQKSSAIKRY